MNTTKPQAIRIAKQFINDELPGKAWYRQAKPYIKAILLYGSMAKGTNRPDSDIDLLIFMPIETEEKYTTGEYVYPYKGYEINIVIRSIERLRKIAAEHRDPFQKEVFRESVTLEATDDEVGRLLTGIAMIPD